MPSVALKIRTVPSLAAAAISWPSGENAASEMNVPVSRKRTSALLLVSYR